MNISEKINLTQASELLGVSIKTVSVLCSEGHIQRDKQGEVTIGGAVHGYIASIKAYGSRADAEYKSVKTEELKHRTAHREGKYQLDANREAFDFCQTVVTMMVNYLDGLPAAATRIPETRQRLIDANNGFKRKVVAHMKDLKRAA
jgi:hypothetical protein